MSKNLPLHTEAVQQKHPNVTTDAVLQSAGVALRGAKDWEGRASGQLATIRPPLCELNEAHTINCEHDNSLENIPFLRTPCASSPLRALIPTFAESADLATPIDDIDDLLQL